jgi:hypothetical protein
MWGYLSGPFLAASALLIVAGVPKLVDPLPLVRAVRSAGLPGGRTSVRLIAAAETAVGIWAILAPGRLTAGLVSTAYLLFTAFVALALRRGGVLGSCGCFGRPDTPPTRAHLALTAAATLMSGAVAASPSLGAWAPALSIDAVATAAAAALIAFLAWQVLAVLPTVTPAAVRSTRKG